MYDVIGLIDYELLKIPLDSAVGNESRYAFSITRRICLEDEMRMSIMSASAFVVQAT